MTWLFLLGALYLLGYYGLSLAMVFAAWVELRRQRRLEQLLDPGMATRLPGVTVVIPAFNEDRAIVRTVRSVLELEYPELEVVVVNDGSTDGTMRQLTGAFGLVPVAGWGPEAIPCQNVREVLVSAVDPRLRVLDKRNGGKADALNAGISYGRLPLVCAVDADVVLERFALVHLATPFILDESVVVTSGTIRPLNGVQVVQGEVRRAGLPASFLEAVQVLEYVRSFTVGRLAFNWAGVHLIVSGAFGMFRREVLVEVGGYQPLAIGEDMELVVRLHRMLRNQGRAYRMEHVARALCFTEAPMSLRELGRQRTRWHLGLLSTLRLHSDLLRPRYGRIAWLALPYFWVCELLAPLAELVGWLLLVVLGSFGHGLWPWALWTLLLVVSMASSQSWMALLLDRRYLGFHRQVESLLRLAWLSLAEHLGYHQATVWFRIRAFYRYYRGLQIRAGWTSPTRAGAPAGAGP